MSNRGQRPRIHGAPRSLCLEGSTPQDRLFIFLPRIRRNRRIRRICLWGRSRSKSFCGLRRRPALAFRHRSLLKTSLGSSPMPQLPVLPAGPSKPPENKITAVGSTKRLPWSHNNILRLVRYLSSGVLPSRQQSAM